MNARLHYPLAVGLVLLAAAVRLGLQPWWPHAVPFASFYVAIFVAARVGGWGPGFLAVLLSVLLGWFAFLPPTFSWRLERADDFVSIVFFLAIACLIAWLSASAGDQGRAAARMAAETARLAGESERAKRDLEVMIETVPLAIWFTYSEGPNAGMVRRNNEVLALLGLPKDSPLLYRPDHEQLLNGGQLLRKGRLLLASELPLVAALSGVPANDDELELVRQDGQRRTLIANARPIRREGAIVGAVSVSVDISELVAAQTALKRSESELRNLANAMPQLVWTADGDGRVDYYNSRREEYFGAGPDAANWEAMLHPDDREKTFARWADAKNARQPYQAEHRLKMADGSYRWHLSRARPDVAANGDILRWYGTATDIHKARTREEHVRWLMREVNHRSKNLLTVAQAIARQTGGEHKTYAEFQSAFDARLASLAAAHDMLVKEEWAGVDLRKLVESQLAHFANLFGTRIFLDGPTMTLNTQSSQTIGLALHELSVNAAKYGALSSGAGKVAVTWGLYRDSSGEERMTLAWIESDGPVVEPPTTSGFGRVVTEKMVASGLSAKVDLQYRSEGVSWTIDAPTRAVGVSADGSANA